MFSATRLIQPGFVKEVIGALKRFGAPSSSLAVEITESLSYDGLMPSSENVMKCAYNERQPSLTRAVISEGEHSVTPERSAVRSRHRPRGPG